MKGHGSHTCDLPILSCKPISETSMSFECPWCGRTHIHGRIEGQRASHCMIYREEYIIVFGDGVSHILQTNHHIPNKGGNNETDH